IHFVVEEQAEKEYVILGPWLRHADAKDALGGASGLSCLRRQKRERFDPCWRILSFRISRRSLTEIEPGAFGNRLRNHFSQGGQSACQSSLRAYAASRGEENRKSNAKEH